ncbi:hypothetical protein CAI21_22135 [Alkalilimnicola ehrlichii]|uniref:Outer membrane protein beta-barrel domain-containing protein n=1 Tax=Alkalilimnicola ehrlichii TaxID=351052 RepID=A0A3E0WT35_9GAMM|nr:hypothetical protein [Alkalilimnicola ehrlichii]RFA24326.1 hypothetical protein CAI21_22135 [Alkalilimnicola ehrlichii]RFA35127.1 hypothetical protein CAL65_13555 [Alkalilimnicola ehrlichii]
MFYRKLAGRVASIATLLLASFVAPSHAGIVASFGVAGHIDDDCSGDCALYSSPDRPHMAVSVGYQAGRSWFLMPELMIRPGAGYIASINAGVERGDFRVSVGYGLLESGAGIKTPEGRERESVSISGNAANIQVSWRGVFVRGIVEDRQEVVRSVDVSDGPEGQPVYGDRHRDKVDIDRHTVLIGYMHRF